MPTVLKFSCLLIHHIVSLKKPVYENMLTRQVVYQKHKTTEKGALHVKLGLFLYVSSRESSGMTPFLKDDPANLNVGPGA